MEVMPIRVYDAVLTRVFQHAPTPARPVQAPASIFCVRKQGEKGCSYD